MSFCYKYKALGSENLYDSKTQPEISAYGDENTGEGEAIIIESSEKKQHEILSGFSRLEDKDES